MYTVYCIMYIVQCAYTVYCIMYILLILCLSQVSGCHKHNGNLTDKALEPLFSLTTQLQYINLEFQRGFKSILLTKINGTLSDPCTNI